MAQDLAAQWKALTPQQRDQAMSRMSADQKKQLAASLGYQEQTQTQTKPKTVAQQYDEAVAPLATTTPHNLKSLLPKNGRFDPKAYAHEAGTALSNIGAGGLGVILHPVDTAVGMGKFALRSLPPVELAENLMGRKGATQEMAESFVKQPLESAETMAGQSAVMGGATEGLKAIPKVGETLARTATRTGPSVTKELVKDTSEANAAALEKNKADVAKAEADRKVDLKKHFEKTKEAKEQNQATEAAQSRKTALTRGVEQLDERFKDDLKNTELDVRKKAGAKYDAVREKVGGLTVPNSDLASAVRDAEKNISGSTENIKIFRDILSKHPAEEPEFIEYQGADIPKGHPLYDVLKEQGGISGAAPATFSDLQGYYSELGRALSKGNLPDDVFRAIRDLHQNIGNMMQGLSDQAGVGPQFSEARNFYRQYMQTFRDYSSPLYKAMKATERGKSIAALAGMDQTGIEALAKYNPELAQRANTVRGYQAEAKAPVSRKAIKSLPKLGPKETVPPPETKTIGAEDIQKAKQDSLAKQTDRIRKYTTHAAMYVTTYRSLVAIGRAMAGDVSALGQLPADLAEGAAVVAGGHGLAAFLENPKIVNMLTKATEADVAQIPPEMRGDLSSIVNAAQKQGIKVSPALIAATGVTPKKRVAAALSGGRDQYMAVPNPKGLVEKGNIPIWNRPVVQNADGSHSTEYSTSFEQDGHEVLVPTVVNGKFLTPDGKKPPKGSAAERAMFKAAWDHYLKTGENLGKFDNPDDAGAYAGQLHNRGNQ